MPAESTLRDRAGPGFALIETMRWEPGGGFLRLERHIGRLRRSAREFGFAFDEGAVRDRLRSAAGQGPAALRVRLCLERDGKAEITVAPFSSLPAGTVWRLVIARTRLDSADRLLVHKTTRRSAYERARAEFRPEEADEVLLLNEKGEACEGTITNLFAVVEENGPMITPPLSCGLLAGILREELLEKGSAREGLLTVEDLARARALFVGNSLRGLIPGRLVKG